MEQQEIKLYRDIRKDERRKIALEIMKRVQVEAPYATDEFVALNDFTKGYNVANQALIDFAWEIGARQDEYTPPTNANPFQG